jgi:hypothetical protein
MIELPLKCHTVTATFHPSFAMHGMSQFWGPIYTAIQRAQRWAARETGPARPPCEGLLLDPTPDDVADYVKDARVLSVDLETPRDNRRVIDLCGVSK